MSFVSTGKAARVPAAQPTDDFARRFQAATLRAAAQMRELFTIETLERAIAARSSMLLVTDYRWRFIDAQLTDAVEEALRQELGAAGEAELRRLERSLAKAAPVLARFDLRNPFSEDFVRRRGGELIAGITGQARERIRALVESGFVDGVPVRTTARAIRETLGLDSRGVRAVESQIRALADAGSPDDVIERMAQAYADRLLSSRAETIARTETMTAANQGTLDSWRQASREGLIPGGMQKRWIHAKGSLRTCPICNELGGSEPVPMGGQFYSSILGESFDAPPAHPNCRCTVGLVRP